MSDEEFLPEIEENPYGIVPKNRGGERPYLSTEKEREKWMQFNVLDRTVLNGRITELKGRVEQVQAIYLVKKNGLYLVSVDKLDHRRQDDSYFRDWLNELAREGVAYGQSRLVKNGSTVLRKWTWDDVEEAIDICLSKGLDLEWACKVAVVGIKALKKYLETGIISIQSDEDERVVLVDDPQPGSINPQKSRYTKEEQAGFLMEIARSNSSRGATMIARDRTGTKWVGVANIWKEIHEKKFGEYIDYNVGLELVSADGQPTPYESHIIFEPGTPPEVVTWALSRFNEKMAKVV